MMNAKGDAMVTLLNLAIYNCLSTRLVPFSVLSERSRQMHPSLREGNNTVKPPNRGHFGDGPFVPCREVVLFSEVLF